MKYRLDKEPDGWRIRAVEISERVRITINKMGDGESGKPWFMRGSVSAGAKQWLNSTLEAQCHGQV